MDPDEQPPQSPTLSDDEQISLAAETPPERAATPPPTPAAAAAAETPRTPKGAVKRWCFTVNNPGAWEPLADVDDMAEIGYIVWQTERGDREGTKHIQGYVRFQRRMRLNAVKQFFKRRDMHLEGARGSEAQNKDYCTKESSRVDGTHGEASEYDPKQGQQGRRSDLEAIAEEVKPGLENGIKNPTAPFHSESKNFQKFKILLGIRECHAPTTAAATATAAAQGLA